MTEIVEKARACPKDGTDMAPMGRRAGAWRCPACKGVFLDVEAMKAGRRAKPPVWAPMVWSVVMSVVATVIARRFLRHGRR